MVILKTEKLVNSVHKRDTTKVNITYVHIPRTGAAIVHLMYNIVLTCRLHPPPNALNINYDCKSR